MVGGNLIPAVGRGCLALHVVCSAQYFICLSIEKAAWFRCSFACDSNCLCCPLPISASSRSNCVREQPHPPGEAFDMHATTVALAPSLPPPFLDWLSTPVWDQCDCGGLCAGGQRSSIVWLSAYGIRSLFFGIMPIPSRGVRACV